MQAPQINEGSYIWAFPLTARAETTDLILHHSAADNQSVTAIHSYHLSKGWSGIAYHYYIRKDGNIWRGRPEHTIGGHTQNWNKCSIGICFEGNFEQEEMTSAQKAAGLALIADIKNRYPGIIVGGHGEYGATACPGKHFPLQEMKEVTLMDNTPNTYATEAVAWAQKESILHGDENGDLKLHEPITRQDMLVFLHRYNSTAH